MSAASLAFRVIYNFFFYFLYLVLLAFLLVTPADFINQARIEGQSWNIIVITLCYVVTVLVVFFIYAVRLYINRSVLASIPKPYIPIEKGDVASEVRHIIQEGLSKSATIAYEARPRLAPLVAPTGGSEDLEANQNGDATHPEANEKRVRFPGLGGRKSGDGEVSIKIPPKPVWGEIEHPGWGSPTSPDLPNLQYSSVILELPNLIEAKALTLAPPDPGSLGDSGMLNPDAVGLLQRTESMGLREYLAHLTDFGVLTPLALTNDFITSYEHARFSTRPISNDRFRHLMHLFAEILRNMHPLNPAILKDDGGQDGSSFEDAPSDGDVDDNAPMGTNPSTPGSDIHHRPRRPEAKRSRSAATGGNGGAYHERRISSSTASPHPRRPHLVGRNSSANTWQYRTAPTTPKSRQTGLSRSSSTNTFAQTRHPYPISQASSPSLRSTSGGSVIRLAVAGDDTDLPYVLRHPVTM